VAGRLAASDVRLANDLGSRATLDLPFIDFAFNRRLGVGFCVEAFMRLDRHQSAWRLIIAEIAESATPNEWLKAVGELARPIGQAGGPLTLSAVTDILDRSDKVPVFIF
jgi:hypothetical protein